MKKQPFDHYQRLISESKYNLWYINSMGYVVRLSKKDNSKRVLKPFFKKRNICVKVSGKTTYIKTLVAKYFCHEYKPGICIGFKDNDPTNCNIENLYFYSYEENGRLTGHMSKAQPLIIEFQKGNKKERIEFRSIREAAKHLYCSYQTLLDYLKGKYKTSVLNDYNMKIYYKEEWKYAKN